MAITVENALELPEMKNMTVAAGATGLWREISTVNVMEVPDISNYLKRGELLLTTMYPIRDNEERQRELIPMLCDKGVAALAIAPLHENFGIPAFMLDQADALDFPILQIPYGTPFNDIMNALLHSIIKTRFSSELIEDILQGKITSLSQALVAGRNYNWNLKGAFIPVATRAAALLKLPPGTIVAELGSDNLLLFPLSNYKNADRHTDEVIHLLKDYPAVFFGVGRAVESIIELPKGFAQAQLALKVAAGIKKTNVLCYSSLGIYRVLFAADNSEKLLFANEYLGAILREAELMITLQEYFNKMGNHRNTAKALYVHHNTVSNRLTRIEQLTGLRLDCADDYLCLQVALKIIDLNL